MNRLFLYLALAPLFAGCLEDRTVGTSTETENAIAARRFDVDSLMIDHPRPSKGPSVATLRLDATNFDFSGTDDSAHDLDVRTPEGRQIPFEVSFWDRNSSRGRLHVRIDSADAPAGSKLDLVWKLRPIGYASPAKVWSGIGDSLRLSLNSVLVDDFEGGSLLSSRLPVASFWYLGISGKSGLTSNVSGRSGSSLHLVGNGGQNDTAPILMGATLLAATPRVFRSMDSIELWARGSGKIWVSLESLDSAQLALVQRGRIDSLQPRRAWTSRTLGSEWSRLRIHPEDFDAPDGKGVNVGWNRVRDSVNYITFLIEGGTEMWIDDLRIHGIDGIDLR